MPQQAIAVGGQNGVPLPPPRSTFKPQIRLDDKKVNDENKIILPSANILETELGDRGFFDDDNPGYFVPAEPPTPAKPLNSIPSPPAEGSGTKRWPIPPPPKIQYVEVDTFKSIRSESLVAKRKASEILETNQTDGSRQSTERKIESAEAPTNKNPQHSHAAIIDMSRILKHR